VILPVEDVAHVTVVQSGSPFEILKGRYVRQRFAPHLHETYAIGAMESGAASCRSRGSESTHAPGDLITIEPDEVHTGAPLTATGWSYCMLYIPRDVMRRAWGDDGHPPRFASTGTRDSELSARLSRVHARFAEPVCLADLASVAEMSVFHLVRQFHRYYGMPPYRYLELVRVQHAKGMLRRGARISTSPLRWGSAIRVI
jgi:AraC-like DNA-binding protein